jgi:hypothetical protein
MSPEEKKEYVKALSQEVLNVLVDHIGEQNAIPMVGLHRAIFGDFNDKINDTRDIRLAVTALRWEGRRIGSSPAGYYLANSASEMSDYTDRLKKTALKKLAMTAKVCRVSLPDLLGQLKFDFEAKDIP